jgi:hypothetical protein
MVDGTLGYTVKDRWVVSGRYAKSTATRGGSQSMTLHQALLEWYPQPEPGRVKLFVNAGAGLMSVALHTTSTNGEQENTYKGSGLPNLVGGLGLDITVVRRFVVTPFISHTRSFGGNVEQRRCINQIANNGNVTTQCLVLTSQPRIFNLTQFGTRIGWR